MAFGGGKTGKSKKKGNQKSNQNNKSASEEQFEAWKEKDEKVNFRLSVQFTLQKCFFMF